MKSGYCRICEFWKKYPYRINDKRFFQQKVREGYSLRKLELLLESYGLKAKKDLIRTHIKNCMNIEVSQQREIEKEIKHEGIRAIGQKLRFFIKPSETPQTQTPECKHERLYGYWDWSEEEPIFITKCLRCGKILGRSFNSSKYEKLSRREKQLLWSLRK